MKPSAWLVLLWLAGTTSASAATAKANLRGTQPDSTLSGTVSLTDSSEGLKLSARLINAPPGAHGFHIHEFGSCDDAGKAAGSHYNPDQVKHGFMLKDGLTGAHAGDFGNLEVGSDGTGTLELTLPNLTVSGPSYNVAGRAVILHEKPDDFSQPTGNAGSRIGCGAILITEH